MKSYEFHDRAQERIALPLFLKANPQPHIHCRNLALEVRGSFSFFINGTTPFHNDHTVSFHLPAPIVGKSAADFQGIAATRLIAAASNPVANDLF